MKKLYWGLGSFTAILFIAILVPLFFLTPIINALIPKYSPWQGGVEYASVNLFIGHAEIENLRLTNEDGEINVAFAEVDVSYRGLLKQRVVVQDLVLQDAQMNIAFDETLNIGGFVIDFNAPADPTPEPETPPVAIEDLPWGFGVETVNIENVQIDYESPEVSDSTIIRYVRLEDIETWDPQGQSPLAVDIESGDKHIHINGQSQIFLQPPQLDLDVMLKNIDFALVNGFIADYGISLVGDLDSQLHIKLTEPQPSVFEVVATGTIDAKAFNIDLPEERAVSFDALKIDLNSEMNLADLTFVDKSVVDVNGLTFKQPGMSAGASINLNSQTQGGLSPVNITSDYDIKLQNTHAFSVFPKPVQADLKALSMQGNASVNLENELDIKQAASYQLEQFTFSAHKGEASAKVLAGFKLLALNKTIVDVAAQTFAVPEVTLTDLFAVGETKDKADVSLGSLASENVNATAQAVKIDTVKMNTLFANYVLSAEQDNISAWLSEFIDLPEPPKEEKQRQPDVLADEDDEEAPEVADVATTDPDLSPAYDVVIGEIILADSSAAYISRDEQKALKLEELNLRVHPVDTTDIEKYTHFTLTGEANDTGSMDVAGKLMPFHANQNLDAKVVLKNVDLPMLNPITQPASGYTIKRGQLSLDNETKLVKNKLSVKNSVELIKLSLSNYQGEGEDKSAGAIGMPPNAAVTILKDGDGNIKLNLPIDGDITDPNFNIGGIISKAVFKAIKETLLLVFKIDFTGDKVSFEPVRFKENRINLSQDMQDKLTDAADAMKQHPELTFFVCAYAKSTEQQPTRTAKDIAKERRKVVQGYLIDRKGVNKKQLASCAPTVGDKEKPRVEISL